MTIYFKKNLIISLLFILIIPSYTQAADEHQSESSVFHLLEQEIFPSLDFTKYTNLIRQANSGNLGAQQEILDRVYEELLPHFFKPEDLELEQWDILQPNNDLHAYFILTLNKARNIPQKHPHLLQNSEKRAATGIPLAQLNLALTFRYGIQSEVNNQEYIVWLTKAAEQGLDIAQQKLGVVYKEGIGTKIDYKKAAQHFTAAAKQGLGVAQANLALACKRGSGIEQNDEDSVKWYTEAAKQGIADAQYKLGLAYTLGQGVKQNQIKAIALYTAAAQQEHTEACYCLGLAYKKGHYVKKSLEKAAKFFTIAANKGYSRAQASLAKLYETGSGVEKDFKEAAKLYKQAANKGHVKAQANLGLAYQTGRGIKQDDEKAIFWLTKAANKEHPAAQATLGLAYELGQGVKQNNEEAIKWYAKAAAHNHPAAQYCLAISYKDGKGVTQSLESAIFWLMEASKLGFAPAQTMLRSILPLISNSTESENSYLENLQKEIESDIIQLIKSHQELSKSYAPHLTSQKKPHHEIIMLGIGMKNIMHVLKQTEPGFMVDCIKLTPELENGITDDSSFINLSNRRLTIGESNVQIMKQLNRFLIERTPAFSKALTILDQERQAYQTPLDILLDEQRLLQNRAEHLSQKIIEAQSSNQPDLVIEDLKNEHIAFQSGFDLKKKEVTQCLHRIRPHIERVEHEKNTLTKALKYLQTIVDYGV